MAISVSMLLLFSRFATSLLMDLFSFFFFGSIHPQDQVIETTFLTNCFGEASITSVLFLSHLKDTAHTIGKGRDSLYFHFSFSSCSPASLVRPSTIKEEGDFFFDLTSAQLARVPLAPLYPMEYSTPAPPFLPNVEAQKTLWYLH